MKKLIILDFTTGDVDIYPVEYSIDPEPEETLHSLSHNPDNCQWMISDGQITFHKEVLK